MATRTREQMIRQIALKTGLPRYTVVAPVIGAFFEVLREHYGPGSPVVLPGIGRISCRPSQKRGRHNAIAPLKPIFIIDPELDRRLNPHLHDPNHDPAQEPFNQQPLSVLEPVVQEGLP